MLTLKKQDMKMFLTGMNGQSRYATTCLLYHVHNVHVNILLANYGIVYVLTEDINNN